MKKFEIIVFKNDYSKSYIIYIKTINSNKSIIPFVMTK